IVESHHVDIGLFSADGRVGERASVWGKGGLAMDTRRLVKGGEGPVLAAGYGNEVDPTAARGGLRSTPRPPDRQPSTIGRPRHSRHGRREVTELSFRATERRNLVD